MGSGRWPIPELALPDAPVTRNPEPAIALDITFPGEPGRKSGRRFPISSTASPSIRISSSRPTMTAPRSCASATISMAGGPFDAERVVARYRIGNGELGNVGWGTLVHLVDPGVVIPADHAHLAAAPGSRRRRAGNDRACAPDRAGGVPRHPVPRRHRARLGGDGAAPSRCRGGQGELPLDRQLAHRVRRDSSRRCRRTCAACRAAEPNCSRTSRW